ncbi:MAG: radical SAM protein [Candidatus Omnitrophica bacterium]|nr:radical SAM protein [Candidatus Omnitrophota bacterium]
MDLPYLLFSDKKGRLYQHPFLRMACSSGNIFKILSFDELIKLPKGSLLFYLPNRIPVGYDIGKKSFVLLDKFENKPAYAVASFLIPAYLRLYNPAYLNNKNSPTLPLWAYTACGYYNGNIYTTAIRIDRRIRQSPRFYDEKKIKKAVIEFLKAYPKNRLYRHLANCALNYNCLAAKNLFLKRWEAPLPTSMFCNARCIGCLSYQESDCVASHQRIKFRPTVEEVFEVMYNHLIKARESIVSFGQGCEGEPILNTKLIVEAITLVRNKTTKGTININTNASIPKNIEILCKSGIDSFRISLNSTHKEPYELYFRPTNYSFYDVLKSIYIAKKYKKFVSINLLVFSGFSDTEEEINSLIKFVKDTNIDMLQLRNLNIDPDVYLKTIKNYNKSKPKGILYLLNLLKKNFPNLKIGYFNLPKEKFANFKNVV